MPRSLLAQVVPQLRESREQRVAKFVRVAEALRDGKPIDPAAADELRRAVLAELLVGNDLARIEILGGEPEALELLRHAADIFNRMVGPMEH